MTQALDDIPTDRFYLGSLTWAVSPGWKPVDVGNPALGSPAKEHEPILWPEFDWNEFPVQARCRNCACGLFDANTPAGTRRPSRYPNWMHVGAPQCVATEPIVCHCGRTPAYEATVDPDGDSRQDCCDQTCICWSQHCPTPQCCDCRAGRS